MTPFLTSLENLVLSIIFEFYGASLGKRTLQNWCYVAARAPRQKIMVARVNRALEEMAIAGRICEHCEMWEIDDQRIYKFVQPGLIISRETVRTAWAKSGMRELQRQVRKHRQ